MHYSTRLFLAAACLLPAACDPGGEAPANDQANVVEATNAVETDGPSSGGGTFGATEAEDQAPVKMAMAEKGIPEKCPIMGDGGWKAGIATTIDGDRILGVMGVITVNTGGYEVKLVPGPLDKMNPPNQHFTLEVKVPTGMVIQRITQHPVHATVPGQPRYASVVISCRATEIERITDIVGQTDN